MKSHITTSLAIGLALSTLHLGGCVTDPNNPTGLALIGQENCIICIKFEDMKKTKVYADDIRMDLKVKPVPGVPAQTPEYFADNFGSIRPVASRYGKLKLIMADDPQLGERTVLFFNNSPILDPMSPLGYRNDDEDIYGMRFEFDPPVQFGKYDILSVRTLSGGQGQRKFAYHLVIISPDKVARVFGHDDMLSTQVQMRNEGSYLSAEYDRTIVFTDGSTIRHRRKTQGNGKTQKNLKSSNPVPDNVCRNFYEHRADLAEAWLNAQNFFDAGQAVGGWGKVAQDYNAFKPDALVKASGKISYQNFKKKVCE